jgi:hypothetical protein
MTYISWLIVIVLSISMIGCASSQPGDQSAPLQTGRPTMIAVRAAHPVKIDGRLDDPVWQQAPAYDLNLSQDKLDAGKALIEGGNVRLAYDDKYVYAGFDFTDSDVVAEGKEDDMRHFRFGDVAELFLSPDGRPYYWELYVTPAGRKTAFFFPSAGRIELPSSIEYQCGLKVTAEVQGTLNHWRNRDRGWTGEMAMPIADLTAEGDKLDGSQPWSVFVGRYNHSAHIGKKELSMTPVLPETSYHLREHYAMLKLQP